MRIGIGLPAAVPGTDMTLIGRWAQEAEAAGFDAVGVIDRLVYDNLDPLIALSAASAATERVELISTVTNVCWRNNSHLLAKQLSSVVRLSAGRLTAGLGMGGWPADYEASAVPFAGRAARFDGALAAMDRAWQATGSRPSVLLGGTAARSLERAASPISDGWVAPLFGIEVLRAGVEAVGAVWAARGRPGRPRIVTGRYFSLGAGADAVADDYIRHYYGGDFFDLARADTVTSGSQLREELERLAAAGCDTVLWFPCSGQLEQIALLSEALAATESEVYA